MQNISGLFVPVLLGGLALPASTAGAEVLLESGARVRGVILAETSTFIVLLLENGIRAVPLEEVRQVARGEKAGSVAADSSNASGSGGRTGQDGAGRKRLFGGEREVALVLAGEIHGEPLDPDDTFTRRRIGHFLENECDPPLKLLGRDGAAGSKRRSGLRMTIEARSEAGKPVTFYDLAIGRNSRCSLHFKLEKLSDKKVQLLVEGRFDENLMGVDENVPRLSRRAYEAAVTELVNRLRQISVFGVRTGHGS